MPLQAFPLWKLMVPIDAAEMLVVVYPFTAVRKFVYALVTDDCAPPVIPLPFVTLPVMTPGT